MPLNLDFTNVKTLDVSPLPAGEYYVQVVACTPKTSSTNKAMLEWRYRVMEGQYENRQLYQNTMLQQENLWKLKQNMIGLGFSEEDLEGSIAIEPGEMIGLECYAVVTQRMYNGSMRNDISRLVSIDEHNNAGQPQQTFEAPATTPVDWTTEVQDDIPFGQDQTQGTALKTAGVLENVGIEPSQFVAEAVAEAEEEDADVVVAEVVTADEEEDEDDDELPTPAITATKAATRLAETYNVTLEDIFAFTKRSEVSRQDVLDYVATLTPQN